LHEKKLKITVDSVHPAREVQTAFRKLEEGHARGKVVVKLDESS
jgi:D-arabinose 1-dehydrogenase-like Zn-dependent alcohol dehydrogenase